MVAPGNRPPRRLPTTTFSDTQVGLHSLPLRPTKKHLELRNQPRVGSENRSFCRPHEHRMQASSNSYERQPTSFRWPGYQPITTGPWLCVPALRLVCLFEDEDAAGPFDAKYKSPYVGRAFVPGFETSVVRHQSPTYER